MSRSPPSVLRRGAFPQRPAPRAALLHEVHPSARRRSERSRCRAARESPASWKPKCRCRVRIPGFEVVEMAEAGGPLGYVVLADSGPGRREVEVAALAAARACRQAPAV